MDRIVIKISPTLSGDQLLRVTDAMLQVIDALKLFDEAERGLGSPHNAFEWRLERASTASPFTVTALAEPIDPGVDISTHVRKLKTTVSNGLQDLIKRGKIPDWMDLGPSSPARSFLERNRNGIGSTEIDFDVEEERISIDSVRADAGIRVIAARTVIDVSADLIDREAFGEIEGVMVAAGRFRNQPAIQIRSELYGFVWCTLSKKIVEKFGSEHAMRDVWEGKTIGAQGVISYPAGGKKPPRIAANEIREIPITPLIDLDSVLDPDFTSGLSPSEYLYQLHEGELA